jgi:DNA polymerase III delta prime subunit|tara:strand:+ start:759 stop:1724 length:966 start_codon:yes stop_codon:yes gene_type:complete
MDTPFIYKYQPKTINDFYITNDLLNLLNNLISINNLNILFIGNYGSGKTSLIKVIINTYYDNNVNDDDILNINTIKEPGITYYRTNVKNFCQTKCSIKGKKKFLILDDIDIVNEQSQQVFRNYIDKYSNNINFIASCNNLQKVIKSLQSRLITAVLNNLENKFLLKILQNICCKENINISNDIKDFLVENSNNSIVTIINNLEKIKLLTNNNDDDFTIESISEICNNISFETMKTYLELCKKKDLQNSINLLYDIYDKGYSVIDILNVLFIYVKNGNLLNENEKYNTITLISKYITIFYNLHEHEIELAIFTNNMVEILDS